MTTCQCQKPLVNAHGCCGYCGKAASGQTAGGQAGTPRRVIDAVYLGGGKWREVYEGESAADAKREVLNQAAADINKVVDKIGTLPAGIRDKMIDAEIETIRFNDGGTLTTYADGVKELVEPINEVMLPPSGAMADGLMEFVEKATDCRCGFFAVGFPGRKCNNCGKTVPVFQTTTVHVTGEMVDSPKGVEIQVDGGGTVFYNPPNDIDLDICPRCKVGRDSRFMVEGGACCYACFEAWMFTRIADLEAENSRLRIIQADRERKAANPLHVMQYHAEDAARTRTAQLEGLAKQFMRENGLRAGECELVEEVKGNCIAWHFRKRDRNAGCYIDGDRLSHVTSRWRDCLEVIEQTYKRHPNGVGVPVSSIRGNALYVLDWRPDDPKARGAVKVEHVVSVDADGTVNMIGSVTDLETFASLVVGGPFPLEVESDADE